MVLIDQAIFQTPSVRVGRFRCSPDHPGFRDAGPIKSPIVVFPRTRVWIEYEGSPPLVADPTVATVYNPTQPYTRAPISADGDRCDWFGVAAEIAVAIASDFAPGVDLDPDRPFRTGSVPTASVLYRRQRALFVRLEAGAVDPLEAEQEVIEIVAAVIGRTVPRGRRSQPTRRAPPAHRELAAAAQLALAREASGLRSLSSLADRLGVSPYHLCRVFRQQTGRTLHQYRLELRLRTALEELGRPETNLSRLALRFGFSSHSHFTAMFRRQLGITPANFRRTLQPRARI